MPSDRISIKAEPSYDVTVDEQRITDLLVGEGVDEASARTLPVHLGVRRANGRRWWRRNLLGKFSDKPTPSVESRLPVTPGPDTQRMVNLTLAHELKHAADYDSDPDGFKEHHKTARKVAYTAASFMAAGMLYVGMEAASQVGEENPPPMDLTRPTNVLSLAEIIGGAAVAMRTFGRAYETDPFEHRANNFADGMADELAADPIVTITPKPIRQINDFGQVVDTTGYPTGSTSEIS